MDVLLEVLGVRGMKQDAAFERFVVYLIQLTEKQKEKNRKKLKVRACVEHIFGFIHTSMNGSTIRSIGIERAEVIIGLMNLTYTMSCYLLLQRIG